MLLLGGVLLGVLLGVLGMLLSVLLGNIHRRRDWRAVMRLVRCLRLWRIGAEVHLLISPCWNVLLILVLCAIPRGDRVSKMYLFWL